MSLRISNVVDQLGIERGTGHVLLILVDEEDWDDDDQHILLLQDKLNRYLAFIETGEVYETTIDGRSIPRGVPVKVRILAKREPTARGNEFLAFARETFAGAGFTLEHKVLTV